jgi:Domain of unknown function (DUF222)/HNH endonuclease
MTVQPIREPAVASWLEVAGSSVAAAGRAPLAVITDDEIEAAVSQAAVLEAQVAALKLVLLAEADRRLAERTAATGTDAWAAKLTGSTRAVMAGGLWLARLLEERYHATRVAFAAGSISQAQARVIVKASEKMPDGLSDEDRAQAEQELLAKAVNGTDPRRLRQSARRMLEVVSTKAADKHEAQQLADEEEAAEVETWLTLHDRGDGTYEGRFVIPELHGHLLGDYLERLSAPRRLSRNKAGKLIVDETLGTAAPTLNWTERLGAAFTELLEHLPTTGHPEVGAKLLVHLDFKHLLDGLASARLDTGARISAGQARRLACNAGIIPVVLGGRSHPLDLGRERRLHSTAQRRALATRYDSCAAEGCDRPFAWTEVHHPHAWSEGGSTDLDNAVPFCGHHHRRAHDDNYDTKYLETGEARFRRRRKPPGTPPPKRN